MVGSTAQEQSGQDGQSLRTGRRRPVLVLSGLCAVLAATLFVAILVGYRGPIGPSVSDHMSFGQAIDGIFGSTSDSWTFWDVRIPRVALAGLIGAGLACAGTAMQAVFRNSMADPFIIGVSSGAAVGAASAGLIGLTAVFGVYASPLLAFVCAIITVFVVYKMGTAHGRVYVDTLLLSGVAIASFLGAVVSFLIFIARQQFDQLIGWLLGSLPLVTWTQVGIVALPVIIGVFIIFIYGRELNALLLGEETAHNLGANPESLKQMMLAVSALMTAAAVAFVGIIGFVGLIVPHMMRLIVGADHRILVPASTIFGAIFLIAADTVARTIITGQELPVGIITALCGGPFFLYLLRRSRTGGIS